MDKKYFSDFETFLIKISIEDLWQLLYPQNRVKMTFKFLNNIFGKLSTTSAVSSELENFSHRTHDAVGDFYLCVQIIEKSLVYSILCGL